MAAAAVAATVILAPLTARETAHFPVSDIKPGMIGTGVTVFEGSRREPFTAQIIGVLENVMGPQRRLILARLEGGPLANTGVIAGMSGSPVFIDGRLVGAVAYSLGQFSREPIAGITPIDEMIAQTSSPSSRPDARDLPPPDCPPTKRRSSRGCGRDWRCRTASLNSPNTCGRSRLAPPISHSRCDASRHPSHWAA